MEGTTIEVTVGIDIGTSAIKAIAVDGAGRVRAHHRVPSHLRARGPGELAHDPRADWRVGVLDALAGVVRPDLDVRAVNVAAMVPSLCAVGDAGEPLSDGVLYSDTRGGRLDGGPDPSSSGEIVRLLGWLTDRYPGAGGYWPAQAMANHALGGEAVVDTTLAFSARPLFDFEGWDPAVAAGAGLDDVARLPRIVAGNDPVAEVAAAGGALLGPGTVDALAEQMVAGAGRDGDVLVILGSTLVVWAVVPEWRIVEGLWTVFHTVPDRYLLGGASNAGGLFLDWARALTASTAAVPADPGAVPVWQPFPRGERVPLHDPDRRASLHDLHSGIDAGAVRRAAYEASGFAVRHVLDVAGVEPERLLATGCGVRDRAWVQALADVTGAPVDVTATPEGGALGAAWLARITAGLEEPGARPDRWARTSGRVDPDPRWVAAAAGRYRRYRELVDRPD